MLLDQEKLVWSQSLENIWKLKDANGERIDMSEALKE
jgi:hypothetical protein